ncbi:MAG TPA: CaiB/BaiF CoA-transferase family protein, partial [Bacillales bacterium]|nr:CaiB/BaiF CoA-transferase family protein [Bacillales bacterium]
NHLVSGKIPERLGNQHPNIVPYQTFKTADGEMVVAVGNDGQFKRFCSSIGLEKLAGDERFATNSKRLENRDELIPTLAEKLRTKTSEKWLGILNESGVPCGPINDMGQLFQEEQVKARDMLVEVEHPKAGKIPLVGSPLKFSRTPVEIEKHPPLAGEHTAEILRQSGWTDAEIRQLIAEGVI